MVFRQEKTGHKTIGWKVEAVIAKTKRQCNDCFNKSPKSHKILWGKSTNAGSGAYALSIAFSHVKEFEKRLPLGSEIFICAYDEKRLRVYKRLIRYGFEIVKNDFKVRNLDICLKKVKTSY